MTHEEFQPEIGRAYPAHLFQQGPDEWSVEFYADKQERDDAFVRWSEERRRRGLGPYVAAGEYPGLPLPAEAIRLENGMVKVRAGLPGDEWMEIAGEPPHS